MSIKTKVVQIGNSEGFRVPKNILNELLLCKGDDVEMSIEDGKLVITPLNNPRAGWDNSAIRLAENKEDYLILDNSIQNDFDGDEWEW
jgi:antitoxin MazE